MKKIFLIFGVAIAITSCGGKSNKNNDSIVIKTKAAKLIDENTTKKFSFIAKPYHITNLSFRVDGPIKEFNAYAGNYFRRGNVIASIDNRDFVITKERAFGIYNQSRAEYERMKNLFEKNNISASTFDKIKADYTSAKASYETSKNQLSDTKLIAPFDGYIGQVFIERHQDVKASQPIVTFVDISKLRIETYVSEEIAMRADEIKDITLRFDAIPNILYRAKVEDISKSTTGNNLSYLLTALLDNNDAKLLSGMSGEVIFESNNKMNIVVVPQTALSHRPTEGDYVWCVDSLKKTVFKRIVKIGRLQPNGYIEIKSNLKDGELVAVSGLRFLKDGVNVKIK